MVRDDYTYLVKETLVATPHVCGDVICLQPESSVSLLLSNKSNSKDCSMSHLQVKSSSFQANTHTKLVNHTQNWCKKIWESFRLVVIVVCFKFRMYSIENLRNRKVTSNVNKCSKCFKSILKLTTRSNWHFGIILRLFWVCFSTSTLKTTAYGLFHDLCHQLWRFGDIHCWRKQWETYKPRAAERLVKWQSCFGICLFIGCNCHMTFLDDHWIWCVAW